MIYEILYQDIKEDKTTYIGFNTNLLKLFDQVSIIADERDLKSFQTSC